MQIRHAAQSVLFATKCHYFIILHFSCSNIVVFFFYKPCAKIEIPAQSFKGLIAGSGSRTKQQNQSLGTSAQQSLIPQWSAL